MKLQYDILVTGRVQNVGYRHFVYTIASAQTLTGWVRNLMDGSVRIIAEGEQTDLDTLKDWLKQGPSRARVSDVKISVSPFTGGFSEFRMV